MAFKFRHILNVLFYSVSIIYPALVFYFLVIRGTHIRILSLFVMAFALLSFIGGTSKKSRIKSFLLPSLLLFGTGVVCLLTNAAIIFKIYPLLMNLLFLGSFGLTLLQPPSFIYRLAILQDKSIPNSPGEKRIAGYCKKVTIIWILFFIFNGCMAGWTIFFGSDMLWSVYNGGISYILMGILFAGEYIARKKMQKKIPKAIPFTAINKKSRQLSTVLCYEGVWEKGVFKTWKDFLEGAAILRRQIKSINSGRWLLYCDDYWFFLLAFVSLLQCKKEILLTANVSPAYIAEICGGEDTVPFLTDHVFPENDKPKNTFDIPAILQAISDADNTDDNTQDEMPPINGDETSIIMYTSGSTGKPKAVKQRLTEFENDNLFVISKWGEELICRKLCSTVSQHHIYGLLYSILLPFTAGIPFRRERIQIPEELEKLSDTKYTIITVPAFLKRAVEIENRSTLKLVSPWIFTSGGALGYETAQKTSEIFGFWPIEVYGSTETSGIAWRQSKKGQEWTLFDNASITSSKEGCLIIRSPYIKDPAGFETADMAEILEDGRFLLKGRIDFVVKIEEKRISLTEMEERIFQSGLAARVCVIPMEEKRQYLAAAVILNNKGKEKFAGLEKYDINKFWRDYLVQYFENLVIPKRWRYPETLPTDSIGKIKREDIKNLFMNDTNDVANDIADDAANEKFNFSRVIEKTENSVSLELSIPDTSPYFDGHFPGFSILPAVAQTELVVRLASKYFGTGICISKMTRVKYTNIIRPAAPLILRLEKGEKTISFKIYSPEDSAKGKKVYSSGTLIIPPANGETEGV